MSMPSWFDGRLSSGNLITILTVLGGIIYSWAAFEGRIAMLEADNRRHATIIERMERERGDLHSRVIRIEEKISNQNDTLQRILRNVERPN